MDESIKNLRDEILAKLKETRDLREEKDKKVEEQIAEIEAKNEANSKLASEIAEINEKLAERESTLDALKLQYDELSEQVTTGSGPVGSAEPTVADEVLSDEKVKAFIERGWHEGAVVCNLEGFFKPERKATTIDSSTVGSSTSGILTPARVRDYIPASERRFTMRDLLNSVPVSTNAVEYPREDTFTNAASPQTEGEAKAESALTFTIVTANVRTLAHWIPASSQVLDDWAQLRRIIEAKLLYGLKLVEEQQILTGNGTGQHLNGLITQAGAYAGTYDVAADTKLNKLRHAITELAVADEQPNFVVLHPADWDSILGIKDEAGGSNVGMYVVGDPTGTGYFTMVRLWGLNVIVTPTMTSGEFLVGDAMQAEIFDRQQASVVLSTEHSDYFTKNLVAIRAEERIALAVYKTTAFLTGTF